MKPHLEFMYDSVSQQVHSTALKPSYFTSKERDAESGLDYFGARYYGSNMGRFIAMQRHPRLGFR